jgi:hypothetical protein
MPSVVKKPSIALAFHSLWTAAQEWSMSGVERLVNS